MEEQNHAPEEHRRPPHPEPTREVSVTVDGTKHLVRRGDYVVSAFNSHIEIKGCEVFVSHVRTGGSS